MSGPRGGLAKCDAFALITSRRFLITSAGFSGILPCGRPAPPSLLRVQRFAEGLFVRDISCSLVHCVSVSLRRRVKGTGILRAVGRRKRHCRKRSRWAHGVTDRWPRSAAGGNRSRRQQPRGAAIAQLMRVGSDQDRYGRVVAFVRIGDSQQSIQEILVEQGQARVAARIGDKACADILLRSERVARAARRGLWADPNFAPLRPEHLDRIAAVRGQFALVEDKVLSVRESGATIYLNFGRRWTRDFTVTILKRHRREYAAAGIDPKGLEGRPIRVRGWAG